MADKPAEDERSIGALRRALEHLRRVVAELAADADAPGLTPVQRQRATDAHQAAAELAETLTRFIEQADTDDRRGPDDAGARSGAGADA